jgi:hypothetical protein
MDIPKVVGPNDGKSGFLGSIGARFLIDGSEAANRFSLVEHPMSAHALAAPLHKHAREDEYSYILEGSIGALLGENVIIGKPGDLIFEKFFQELIDLGGVAKAPLQALTQLCSRYELDIDFDSIPGLVERFGVRFPAEPVYA